MKRYVKILTDIEKVTEDILEFTPQEQEVLDEFAGGWINREAAEKHLEMDLQNQEKSNGR